jgi:hypothetical protein
MSNKQFGENIKAIHKYEKLQVTISPNAQNKSILAVIISNLFI